ncbi:uncharacterized protein LOC143275521 [Babylonia areolata]|uniref:uncharacterized protein LOC143275521 n=1 Tax=Babylonia areolata TaxID=304850 RepID=UPI003FD08210
MTRKSKAAGDRTTPSPRGVQRTTLLLVSVLTVHHHTTALTLAGSGNRPGENGHTEDLHTQPASTVDRKTLPSSNVTFVESVMGSVTLSAGRVSDCFLRNSTLSFVAVDTMVHLPRVRVVRKGNENSVKTGSSSAHTEDTDPTTTTNTFKHQDYTYTYTSDDLVSTVNETGHKNELSEGLNTTKPLSNDTDTTTTTTITTDNNNEGIATDSETLALGVGCTCTLALTVPDTMVSKVTVPETEYSFCLGSGGVMESEGAEELVMYCGADAAFFVSAGEEGEVILVLEVKDSQDGDWLSVTASGSVVMALFSPLAGFVRPADPPTTPPGPLSPPWAMLNVPPRHRVMLSLQQTSSSSSSSLRHHAHPFHCDVNTTLSFVVYYGNLSSSSLPRGSPQDGDTADTNRTLSDQNRSARDNVTADTFRQLDCGSDVVFPVVVSADVVFVRYMAVRKQSGRESNVVSIVFSVHKETEAPVKTAEGTWDCAVPNWRHFRQHFPCDLEPQCRKGEDESQCYYSSQLCDSRQTAERGSCYFTVNSPHHLTWLKANEACAARGGYPVSLNTPEEADDVRSLLRLRPWKDLAFVGLQLASSSLPSMYRHSWVWSDGTVANYLHLVPEPDMTCAAMHYGRSTSADRAAPLTSVHCTRAYRAQVLCEGEKGKRSDWPLSSVGVPALSPASHLEWRRVKGKLVNRLIACPNGHMTHAFLACDVASACFAEDHVTCSAPLTPLPPMYRCACADERVSYTSVCDHRKDCQDNSDEEFCVFPACTGAAWFPCSSYQQCVPRDKLCDGQRHCRDGSDEGSQCETPLLLPAHTPPPPLFLRLDGSGSLVVDRQASGGLANGSLSCTPTHFTCSASSQDCVPVFLRCNQVRDCPDGEDEEGCRHYTCPGFFRCRDSNVCVHPEHLCDGLFQCPQQDDEAFCSLSCPPGCTCQGLAARCEAVFHTWRARDVRYLDGSGSGMSLSNLTDAWFLVYLSLARCGLRELHPDHHHLSAASPSLPNLRELDLSDNVLRVIPADGFSRMENLQHLSLAGNPLVLPVDSSSSSSSSPVRLPGLRTLDLSRVYVTELRDDTLTSLGGVGLEVVNLTDSGLQRVKEAFSQLPRLRVLDLRGCPLNHFPPSSVFRKLQHLRTVFAENYKLCCRGVLPISFDASRCVAPDNQLSSCESLLRSTYYRLFVYLFAALALTGNVLCMGYRTCVNRRDSTQTASVFVSNLSVANFLMGLYLVMIAAADWSYKGSFVWWDEEWRHGSVCQLAGFLFVLSNEVSVLLVCLMTADRYLVLRCPLSALAFQKWSAHAASLGVWLTGFVLASVPLYPSLSHWDFYSQTALCVPLPVSRRHAPGHAYSFFLFNVVKLLLFVAVGVAQGMIYLSIKSTKHAIIADKSKKSMDLIVARRLVTVVMTDFLSWFPIGLLGLLSVTGCMSVTATGEMQVVLALLVLPLNSALNPFLYTLSMARDLRRSRMREKIREDVLSQARHARLQANENRAVTFATRV